MLYFNFNGKLFSEHELVAGPDNRGLRYGDGLFETLKYRNQELIQADEDFARLWKGLNLLEFDRPKLFTPDLIEHEILQLLRKNNHTSARVRFSVIRGNGGLYDTKNHSPNYIIQSWQLEQRTGALNENGLQLCIYPDARKSIDKFSNLKHNNYLPYFMGALFAKAQQCNDAVILNSAGRICDTTIANIFFTKAQSIYTIPLEEGCVAGIMRNFIIEQLSRSGYPVIEKAISEDDLVEADEIFLTNSIYNMRWVAGIGNKKYSNSMVKKIYRQLSETNGAIFG